MNLNFLKQEKNLKIILSLFVILIGLILRLLPHPPNFTPIGALALFSFTYLSRKSFFLPVVILLISDFLIGFYDIKLMVAVYISFLICSLIGIFIRRDKKWSTILESSLLASFVFFLITNFAVWMFTPWYAQSFQGLITCYTMALPFLRNTLLGNIFYTGLLFGIYELALSFINSKESLYCFNSNSFKR
jgi:Zn-dependent protease with chaperone function